MDDEEVEESRFGGKIVKKHGRDSFKNRSTNASNVFVSIENENTRSFLQIN